ncbi:MAG TPA: hypothetical protein VGD43_03180 [Micromonospora sp.]
MADGPSEGFYQIAFTSDQLLTAHGAGPGAPLMLLPPDQSQIQTWRVRRVADGGYTIQAVPGESYISFDGEPDMHELALTSDEPRPWVLAPGAEPDTYAIGVAGAEPALRLGMSLLRIFPPRIALAPEYGDQYQAWHFRPVE